MIGHSKRAQESIQRQIQGDRIIKVNNSNKLFQTIETKNSVEVNQIQKRDYTAKG